MIVSRELRCLSQPSLGRGLIEFLRIRRGLQLYFFLPPTPRKHIHRFHTAQHSQPKEHQQTWCPGDAIRSSLFENATDKMTITTVSLLTTERRLPSPPPDRPSQSQPRIHAAPDFPFKGWQPPKPDGYQQSADTRSESAIVIDNGKSSASQTWREIR